MWVLSFSGFVAQIFKLCVCVCVQKSLPSNSAVMEDHQLTDGKRRKNGLPSPQKWNLSFFAAFFNECADRKGKKNKRRMKKWLSRRRAHSSAQSSLLTQSSVWDSACEECWEWENGVHVLQQKDSITFTSMCVCEYALSSTVLSTPISCYTSLYFFSHSVHMSIAGH